MLVAACNLPLTKSCKKSWPRTAARWYQTPGIILSIDPIRTDCPAAEVTVQEKKSRLASRSLLKRNPSKLVALEFCLKTRNCCPADGVLPAESSESKRSQHATVKLAGLSEGASGICTKLFAPSNPSPVLTTAPTEAIAPPCSRPLFVPATSLAFPSPGHQPISPAGAATQSMGGTTVNV